MVMVMIAVRAVLMLLLLLLPLHMLLHRAGFDMVDILLWSHPHLRSFGRQLLFLQIAELFWRHPSLCGFGCEMLLHGSHLLRRRLAWALHVAVRREARDREFQTGGFNYSVLVLFCR
jgi:hypothetical protein